MARKLLIRTDQFPYHVTTRSRNKDWYDLPMKKKVPGSEKKVQEKKVPGSVRDALQF